MPFEEKLGEALRRAGDDFTPDPTALVEGGERRGRRMVARRRAAVAGGSVLVLAVIGTAGVYTGRLTGGEASRPADMAARSGPPSAVQEPPPPLSPREARTARTGSGAVGADQMVTTLTELLPDGTLTDTQARGTGDPLGAYVAGVFDEGKGGAAVSVGLRRIDPKGRAFHQETTCPDKNLVEIDHCTEEVLPDGSRLLFLQGYEYPDRREPTKRWWATLATPQGFLVTFQEHNASAEKGAPVSRTDPPLDLVRSKELVRSERWHAALNDLPPAKPDTPTTAPAPPAGKPAEETLEVLLRASGIPSVSQGGEGEYGYAVLDDGKGRSLVQVNVQPGGADLVGERFTGAATEPDGTQVKEEQQPGEKGGKGVVRWSVDTLRPDGLRVVVSAFNTPKQSGAATRPAPALTMAQLREIALSPQWTTAD
ncbi:hypothetical protein [Streptomyces sp. NPDC051567]|uniref:hypothetical protein n=1 Tax=Streptomyces sp. NPDC051567 TaxID=3365660 RepID=UPI0037A42BC3